MQNTTILFALIILNFAPSYAQSFFSIVPDFGGDEMEGMAYNVIPLEEDIKVIGLVHDSLVPGFDSGNWPVMGSISYDGEYLGTEYLVDSAYSDGFVYFTRRIAFKNDSIGYLYDRRNMGNMFLEAYLAEINFRKGKILRSKIVYDEITQNEDFATRVATIGDNGNLYLINVTTQFGTFPPILTILDSAFTLVSQMVIPNFGRKNYPNYIERNDSDNLVIVGMSLGEPTPVWWESKLYKQVLDSNYTSVEFTFAPTEFDQSIILADHYPVIKGRDGNWIIASQRVVETANCQDCSNGIPYVVGISADFSEVLWETRMFDGDESSSNPLYWASSVTEVHDGYIFAGAKQGGVGNTSGILGKVSLNGDSLWLKHYIPVGWDSTQALWFDLKDIKTTPTGNIVACGRSYDRFSQIRVPWILHLDPDGCLEPGCQPSSVSNGGDVPDLDIRIFPNPVRAQCSIHIQSHISLSNYTLRILDNQGALIRNLSPAGKDVYYLLDLQGWPSGTYYVQLIDQRGRQLTRKFVVLD